MDFDRATLAPLLADGVRRLQLTLPEAAEGRLLDYLELLTKWNRAFNLTAVRDPREMVVKHLLDSLAVLPHLGAPAEDERGVADVGAGAGLPGIPLAIAAPRLRVELIDSNGKKCRFMEQAVTTLAIENATVHHLRVERYRPPRPFAGVVSRAFASLSDMVAVAGHLCAEGGRLYAMKGVRPTAELESLEADGAPWEPDRVVPIEVPGLTGERCLVVLRRRASAGS